MVRRIPSINSIWSFFQASRSGSHFDVSHDSNIWPGMGSSWWLCGYVVMYVVMTGAMGDKLHGTKTACLQCILSDTTHKSSLLYLDHLKFPLFLLKHVELWLNMLNLLLFEGLAIFPLNRISQEEWSALEIQISRTLLQEKTTIAWGNPRIFGKHV